MRKVNGNIVRKSKASNFVGKALDFPGSLGLNLHHSKLGQVNSRFMRFIADFKRKYITKHAPTHRDRNLRPLYRSKMAMTRHTAMIIGAAALIGTIFFSPAAIAGGFLIKAGGLFSAVTQIQFSKTVGHAANDFNRNKTIEVKELEQMQTKDHTIFVNATNDRIKNFSGESVDNMTDIEYSVAANQYLGAVEGKDGPIREHFATGLDVLNGDLDKATQISKVHELNIKDALNQDPELRRLYAKRLKENSGYS